MTSGGTGRRASGPQLLGEIIWQVAGLDRSNGLVHVVLRPHELHLDPTISDVQDHVAGTPVAVLRPTDAADVQEVEAAYLAVPGSDRSSVQ